MTSVEWTENMIGKQPVFNSKNAAIQAAIKANKKMKIHDIWKEPKSRGGRFVVAAPQAFEALYREKYTRILDAGQIADIERGDDTDDIEEVE